MSVPGLVSHNVITLPDGMPQQDSIAEETAVALVYNGISYAVMMATPVQLKQFAIGFSFTEGIIEHPQQIYDVSIHSQPGLGIEIHIELGAAQFNRLKQKRRALSGKTGCGICGLESLQQLKRDYSPLLSANKPSHQTINTALNNFSQQQPLQAQAGALHAAAFCNLRGEIVCSFEDVGRHNALDKLIGSLLEQTHGTGFILISSRASFEMVSKTLLAGVSCLVAVSAPTAMAIELAREHGLTLIGFARQGRQVVYHQGEAAQ